ncbi:hypothetical protein E5671_20420 [Streptomyces sp. BA2]|nr:hypothetical protein [Streptomyces sp. BA2]
MADLRQRHRRAPARSSAVRRRPSLPRPAPVQAPPDRHQQRRLARSQSYTDWPSEPQPASPGAGAGGQSLAGPWTGRQARSFGTFALLNLRSRVAGCLEIGNICAILFDEGVRRST